MANRFKQALQGGGTRIGFWLALGDSYSAEICAGAGFDWLVIDAEHGPQHLPGVLGQLQAIASGGPEVDAVVRVSSSEPVAMRQYLDLGVQTLLVPMVDSADEASEVVRACRYPPRGSRGIGGARAARWGRNPAYVAEANDDLCIIVQAESATALANLEEIAAVEGVDALFIGPADLAASMGLPGQAAHPQVKAAVVEAFGRLRALGKPAGTLSLDEQLCRDYVAAGASFIATGLDTHMLARSTSALAARFADLRRGAAS